MIGDSDNDRNEIVNSFIFVYDDFHDFVVVFFYIPLYFNTRTLMDEASSKNGRYYLLLFNNTG